MDLYDVNPELSTDAKSRIEAVLGFEAKKIRAKFLITAPKDGLRSQELGRPIHVDMVSIIEIPEGVADYVTRPATEADKHKYPNEWARFQQALADPKFPIEHLAGAKPCEVAMFRENGITTIQAAAAMTTPQPELVDAVLRAKRWMMVAAGEKPRIKLAAVA